MTEPTPVPPRRSLLSDWYGGVFAAVIWLVVLIGWLLDIQSFAWFLGSMAVTLVMTLLFLVWWFTRRSFPVKHRILMLAFAVAFGVLVGRLSATTINQPVFLAIWGVPILLAVWWMGYVATRGLALSLRAGALIACFLVVWGGFLLIRLNGYRGNLRAAVSWRWTPTGEELYLAERPKASNLPTTIPSARALELRPGDWPAFRGPNRDGVVRNLRIALDWKQSPPKVLWRQRVGPAWSSMAVVDGHLFTQEQRGQREAVVCRDALSGQEIWAHDSPGRFDESMSGPGPRATPAFADGKIYAQGAMGALDCLDAASGRLIWTHDVGKDAEAELPIWGFCNSPLVVDNRVIVFAGGNGKKSLLAYGATDGNVLWTADAGKMSYGSPQTYDGLGSRAVLMFTNQGLFAVDPSAGKIRWQYPTAEAVGLPAALQVCQAGPGSLVLGNGAAFGAQRIHVSGEDIAPTREWQTPRMKPAFSDMAFHDGMIYGFDGTVFCCVEAATGTRRWREGRYGAGQMLLLEDQGVMIVTSEEGQVILLRCNPDRSEELGHIDAISGKAWNHPAIAGDRLYVRSDAEMACLQLRAVNEDRSASILK